MGAMTSGAALRLPLGEHRFFDLREVMAAVGDWSRLHWVLRGAWFNGDVRPVWPEGHEYAEAASDKPGGIPLSWEQMSRLAEHCQQVIDGRFTGYDEDGQPVLQLLALDSSYWVVWARDRGALDPVRASFPDAEPYEEPTPEAL